MSSISIVIPVFNQSFLTDRCLSCLLENTEIARELIVVDNHSADGTPQLLARFESRFREKGWSFQVIRNEENRGFGRAVNQGIRAATGENVVVLNNDTWLMQGWDAVLSRRQRELGADMIGPVADETPYDSVETPRRLDRLARRNRGKSAREWMSILMYFPRKTLDSIGLFDERYFVTFEDRDLRERMDRAGMRYYQTADCWIWHFSKGTRGQTPMPSNYELEGLRLFREKWGFDPRLQEATRVARLKRRWKKIKTGLGLF